jgi:hypothetical protein
MSDDGRSTVDSDVFQRESQPTTIKNDGESLEVGFFELCPDSPALAGEEEEERDFVATISSETYPPRQRRQMRP